MSEIADLWPEAGKRPSLSIQSFEMLEKLVPSNELIDEVRVGRGDFVAIGDGFINNYWKQGWVQPDSVFLDVGCGLGRLARPLARRLSERGEYFGFDINRRSIDWCLEKYAEFPNFHFSWIDLKSVVYNPTGTSEAGKFVFPLPRGSVDFVNLTSVFTHMLMDGVRNYLHEISRVMKPGARCSITYFLVSEGMRAAMTGYSRETATVPLLGSFNWPAVKGGYVRNANQPEDVVLLDEEDVRSLYRDVGLEIESVQYGRWCDHLRQATTGGGQDTIVAIKPLVASARAVQPPILTQAAPTLAVAQQLSSAPKQDGSDQVSRGEIPSFRAHYIDVLSRALKHPYTSTSSKDEIKTGNNYQSIDLGSLVTGGGRPARQNFVRNLNLQNKTVLDIGANMGEMSRLARRGGASLVDGFEYDAFFVECGRIVNAVTGTTRVSLFQGDATDPRFYDGMKYDVIFAWSVFVYIDRALDRLRNVSDVMVFETHTLDHGLDFYLSKIVPYFPAYRLVGYTESPLDIRKSRALLVFGATDDAVASILRIKPVLSKNYFQNNFITRFGRPTGGDIAGFAKSVSEQSRDTIAEPLTGFNDRYLQALIVGYSDYLDAGRVVTPENTFFQRYRDAIVSGRIDNNLKALLSMPDYVSEKVALKFRDIDNAASGRWMDIAPITIISDPDGKLQFEDAAGGVIRAKNIDGHHRFFIHQLLNRETIDSLIVS